MKKLYAFSYIIIALCIIGTAVLLIFMPNTIPVHYNFAGKVDRFVSIAIGILLIVLGNIMPKMRRNSLFGLRTKWSMANDSVWQKSQRFGGIASVLCGLVMIIAAIFVSGVWNILLMTAVFIAWVTASIIASYRYYQADVISK